MAIFNGSKSFFPVLVYGEQAAPLRYARVLMALDVGGGRYYIGVGMHRRLMIRWRATLVEK